MRKITRALFLVSVVLTSCGVPREERITEGKDQYLSAKAACVAAYPGSLTLQSDCRTRAANEYIRPWYRYGDLMTRLQETRRVLAVEADAHEITRAEFNRQVAKAEKSIAHEEAQRNEAARMISAHNAVP